MQTINETYKGKTYKTLATLAKATRIKHRTLWQRYVRGARGEDLVKPVTTVTRDGINVTYKGVEYHNITDLSLATGIRITTLRMRYKAGDRGKKLTRPVKNYK